MPTPWLLPLCLVLASACLGCAAWAAAWACVSLQRIHAQQTKDTLDRFLARSPMDLVAFPPAPIELPEPDPDEAALRDAVKRFESFVESDSLTPQ
jgi:hypothetical protein